MASRVKKDGREGCFKFTPKPVNALIATNSPHEIAVIGLQFADTSLNKKSNGVEETLREPQRTYMSHDTAIALYEQLEKHLKNSNSNYLEEDSSGKVLM